MPRSESESDSEEYRRRKKRRRTYSGWNQTELPPEMKLPPGVTLVAGMASAAAMAAPISADLPAVSNLETEDNVTISGGAARAAMSRKLAASRAMTSSTATKEAPPPPRPKPTAPTPAAPAPRSELTNPLLDENPETRNPLLGPALSKPKEVASTPAAGVQGTPFIRVLELDVPRSRTGVIIGKRGIKRAEMQERFGVSIEIPGMDSPANQKTVVKGNHAGCTMVKREIEQLLGEPIKIVSDVTQQVASNVICLTNMVSHPDDADDALVKSVRDECSRFGAVTNVLIYDEKQGDGSIVVKIFVQFLTQESAGKAREVMHNRFFDGRRIRAVYFPEDHFKHILNS